MDLSNSAQNDVIVHRFEDREILPTDRYWDQKDPCPVIVPDKYNGRAVYHIYGTRGDDRIEYWEIFHAVSAHPDGPWTELEPIRTNIKGAGVAAPGVIYDEEDEKLHMFMQTDFKKLGGKIEHLVSEDGGYSFYHQGTALNSGKGDQAGVYDPQPLTVKTSEGKTRRFLVHTGMPKVSHGDVFLAESQSNSWDGPFETKKIIAHEDIPHHNPHDHADYEWGLEGGNIAQLPNGKFFFLGVCFLPEGRRGTRQRVFGAISDKIDGPYKSIGPLIEPLIPGENGHPGIIVEGNIIRTYYQKRHLNGPWRIAKRDYTLSDIGKLAKVSGVEFSTKSSIH